MTRAELKESYAALPLPTTNDESWRFTDLKGFDPDSYASNGHGDHKPAGAMLDVDVTGLAVITESGIEIERVPRRDRLRAALRRAGASRHAGRPRREVRRAQRRAVEARSARRDPEGRAGGAAALRAHREHRRRRRALLPAARDRRGGLARHADRGVHERDARARRLHERRRRALRRAEREARVRLAPEPLEVDVALREPPRARRARRRARLGRRRLRLEARQDADPERPRRPGRDLASDRRVLRRRRPAPGLRHVPGAHRAEHDFGLRLQGRAPRRGDGGVARDDPRREGSAEDERVPGEPESDAEREGACRLDPGPGDPGERRALHPRRDARARSTASSSST